MTKFLWSAVFCAGLMLAFNGVADGRGGFGNGGGGGGNNAAAEKSYTGVVSMARQDIIVLKSDDGSRISAKVTASTVITAAGQPATMDDVAQGQTVSLTIANYKATAIDIKVNGAKPAK